MTSLAKIKLHGFQQEAINRIASLGSQHCALYHSMGLGKTFTGAEILLKWPEPTKLVICQKSKIKDWIDHLTKYYSIPVLDLTKPAQFKTFCGQDGSYIGVINYDLIYRRLELTKLKSLNVLFDESSMLKNEKTKRTKAAFKLNSIHNVLLSGTPVGGKYEELWAQCHLLGWRISKKEFYEKYIITQEYFPPSSNFPIKLVTGYKNTNDLIRSLKQYGADFLKSSDVIELPQQRFTIIRSEPPKQYKEFIKQGVTTIEGTKLVADTPTVKLLGARKLCSYYNENKLTAFKDWISSTQERLVVFYNFTEELNRMLKVVGQERPVSYVNGKGHDLRAYETASNSITFIQYQAGAKGLNLTKAHIMALYSPTLSAEDYIQCLKRIHRISQTQACLYYFFITTNTVEGDIYATLKRRENYTARLFEG